MEENKRKQGDCVDGRKAGRKVKREEWKEGKKNGRRKEMRAYRSVCIGLPCVTKTVESSLAAPQCSLRASRVDSVLRYAWRSARLHLPAHYGPGSTTRPPIIGCVNEASNPGGGARIVGLIGGVH